MNIGIDIDGVLTDIHDFNRRHAPPFFKRKFNREVVDESPYNIRDIFDCTQEEFLAYWKKYLLKYTTLEPARKGAKSAVRQLMTDGHSICIISKRVFSWRQDILGKLMRFLVRSWLRRNGIRWHEIVFCDNDITDSKRAVCQEKKVDVMVDDDAENIYAVAPIAKVICFDTSYNRDCEGENITRAYNWDEVYSLITEIANET